MAVFSPIKEVNRQKIDILYLSLCLWVGHDLKYTLFIERTYYDSTKPEGRFEFKFLWLGTLFSPSEFIFSSECIVKTLKRYDEMI